MSIVNRCDATVCRVEGERFEYAAAMLWTSPERQSSSEKWLIQGPAYVFISNVSSLLVQVKGLAPGEPLTCSTVRKFSTPAAVLRKQQKLNLG